MARTTQKSKDKAPKEKAISIKTNPSKKISLSSLTNYRPSKKGWIIILATLIVILIVAKKDLFLAATVNGSPISNIELLSRINQQYRTQMLNQMINEKLITTEAQKKGINISNQEINNRISELEGNVGGAEALDGLLSQQGQTRDTLQDQIKIQLIVEKLYANEATVSAEEVDAFLAENSEQIQATDSAGQTKEATEILKQQKLSKAFNENFQQLKSSAKIQTF